LGKVRDFVREKEEFARALSGQIEDRLIPAAFGVEAIEGTCWQKNGGGNAKGLLMRDELVVGAPAVISVLMDVDDRLGSRFGRVEQGCCAQQRP